MADYILNRPSSAGLTFVHDALAVTATEDRYEFVDRRPGGGVTTVEITPSATTTFRTSPSGPGVAVAAGTPFRFPLESGASFYLVTSTTSTVSVVFLG